MSEVTSQNVNTLHVLRDIVCKDIRGLGGQRTLALISHFGAKGLVDAMRNEAIGALTVVKGISVEIAAKLCLRYPLTSGYIDLAVVLDERGFKKPMAVKFWNVWKEKALDVIDANPYVLLSVMDWDEVDAYGKTLGNEFHPCRVIGAIEWCIFQDFENNKNSCTSRETLRKEMRKLIGSDDITFQRGLDLAVRTGAVIEYQGWYQVPAIHWYERLVERFLKNNEETGRTEEEINDWLVNNGYQNLNPEQRMAVVNAFSHRISAYYGRGGCGKTWTLKAIAHGALDKKLLNKGRVVLAAVAAIAKSRMRAETGHPAKDCLTIAGLIHIEKVADMRNALIAIDEASMLSLLDAFRLFKKVPYNTNIVLMGDHQQMPSIQAGSVFYDIITNKAVPSVELVKSHRHDEKTDNQLQMILKGQFPVFDKYVKGCGTGLYRRHVAAKSRDEAQRKADSEAIELYLEILADDTMGDESVQIISPLRKKNYTGSSEMINHKLHSELYAESDGKFPVGTPVVWNQKKTVKSGEFLSKGSLGRVLDCCDSTSEYVLKVAFEIEGVVELTHGEVNEYLEHAYCLSVHRAQGSEWDNVIILLPRSERMIDRNMVYTALSRCRKRSIIIYCDHLFVKRKVALPPAHECRNSLLLRRVVQ